MEKALSRARFSRRGSSVDIRSYNVIFATYGQELSDDFGRRVRNFITDPVHQAIFPNCRLSEDSTAAHRFNTTAGGAYFAVGREGRSPAEVQIYCLLMIPLKMREKQTVKRFVERFRNGTRLWPIHASRRVGPLLSYRRAGTRMTCRLAATRTRKRGWDVLRLPAIAEQDEGFRKEGEALWPEKYPLPELERIRMAIGGRAWASMYQQRPAAAEGVIFKRDWWQFFPQPLTVKLDQIVQSWDTAFKTGTENDFSVCTTWGVAGDGYYLLHVWRDRVEFPELKRVFATLAEQWNPNAILVEDKASGQSLIQELKISTTLPLIPVNADRDKQTRAQAVTPLIEAGKVFLPQSAPWVSDFVEEMASFPNGVHDDVVDATTQALNYLRVKPVRWAIVLGPSSCDREVDKEDLWEKAMLNYPMSPEEIARM